MQEQIFLRHEIVLKWFFETHDVKTWLELVQDKIKQSNKLSHFMNGENFLHQLSNICFSRYGTQKTRLKINLFYIGKPAQTCHIRCYNGANEQKFLSYNTSGSHCWMCKFDFHIILHGCCYTTTKFWQSLCMNIYRLTVSTSLIHLTGNAR